MQREVGEVTVWTWSKLCRDDRLPDKLTNTRTSKRHTDTKTANTTAKAPTVGISPLSWLPDPAMLRERSKKAIKRKTAAHMVNVNKKKLQQGRETDLDLPGCFREAEASSKSSIVLSGMAAILFW